GRNLIVSIDGTSNQFGVNNTNVIELHSHVDTKDQRQLKCYISGIGTALPPSPWAITHWKVKLGNWIDLAIAWYERRFCLLYRWLMDHYLPGDKIFLFGFSRGAYQIRTLAGIIGTLGLLEAGNKSMIPLCVYQVDKSKRTLHSSIKDQVANFKRTFSHSNVQVHFVGAWYTRDTVSSVGLFRSKPLLLKDQTDHICFFRHALALDERRVKFIPEYLERQPETQKRQEKERHEKEEEARRKSKEVWFSGTHSDILPLLWMENEANLAGLILKPRTGEDADYLWKGWETLKDDKPTESLKGLWRILEYLPIVSWTKDNNLDSVSRSVSFL
ncbi:hypothetical protein K435DRAFT_671187, partial [Dendrothele bispora CBS 962.96]